jgi:hypothetical protein
LLVVVAFAGILFAQGVREHIAPAQQRVADDTLRRSEVVKRQPAPRKRKVDYIADLVKPYNQGSDSVIYFVGNFAAHHNGAVIWCDSAVRYNDTRWGFFSRVVINQDSIYIYGDSAIYDGDAAHAEIYAPIIKVVDGDALLYTYNFSFNTESRVGQYTGGGVLVHDNNILESIRGYYDSNEHNIICIHGNVFPAQGGVHVCERLHTRYDLHTNAACKLIHLLHLRLSIPASHITKVRLTLNVVSILGIEEDAVVAHFLKEREIPLECLNLYNGVSRYVEHYAKILELVCHNRTSRFSTLQCHFNKERLLCQS